MIDRAKRQKIARKRLVSILSRHKLALGRTLEQKIADAGPYNQRIDPHIITETRRALINNGQIVRLKRKGTPWFHLSDTPADVIEKRLQEQEPIHNEISLQAFTKRVGQALEIAVFRALCAPQTLQFTGHYYDLDTHDDSTPYQKEEPPSAISGKAISGDKKLDFIVTHPTAGVAGIEVKNIREWLYFDRDEVKALLGKCLELDAVPVLIGRRIHYVTRRLLNPCGVLVWETYNQRYPAADHELAAKAKHKNLLGYHDIRLGNEPGSPLTKFITEILPEELPNARVRFNNFKDLLEDYTFGDMPYEEFSARIRRREDDTNEDNDWEDI